MSNIEYAELLKSMATHFVPRDWNYTRDTKIKHIRYEDAFEGYYSRKNRVKRALKAIVTRGGCSFFSCYDESDSWHKKLRYDILERIGMARIYLKTDNHTADGVLDSGGIITFWEEDGEYLQMVQPQVGEMFADWLIAEPDNAHAQVILAELERIQTAYSARIKAGEAS